MFDVSCVELLREDRWRSATEGRQWLTSKRTVLSGPFGVRVARHRPEAELPQDGDPFPEPYFERPALPHATTLYLGAAPERELLARSRRLFRAGTAFDCAVTRLVCVRGALACVGCVWGGTVRSLAEGWRLLARGGSVDWLGGALLAPQGAARARDLTTA